MQKSESDLDAANAGVAKTPVIKTPQDLIHINHRINLLQYKYWILMLRAYRDTYEQLGRRLTDEEFCYLPIKSLIEHVGYSPSSTEIEMDLEAIRKELISFNVLGKDGTKSREGTGFITSWSVSNGIIGVIFPAILRRSIENLDSSGAIFHLLNWKVFNSFNGKYEAFLYNFCKDYSGVGRTPYLSVKSFREYMGVKDAEYIDYKRLSQWVILTPVKRINESDLTDITVEVVLKREGRRVVGLHFKITPKGRPLLSSADHPAFKTAKVAISPADQRKHLNENDPVLIELAIERVNEYVESQERLGKDVNIGALYRKAIEDEWGRSHQLKKEKQTQRQGAQKTLEDDQAVVLARAKESASQNRLKTGVEHDQRVRIASAIKSVTPEQMQAYVGAYQLENTAAGMDRTRSYKSETREFGDAVERANFKVWLRQKLKSES